MATGNDDKDNTLRNPAQPAEKGHTLQVFAQKLPALLRCGLGHMPKMVLAQVPLTSCQKPVLLELWVARTKWRDAELEKRRQLE